MFNSIKFGDNPPTGPQIDIQITFKAFPYKSLIQMFKVYFLTVPVHFSMRFPSVKIIAAAHLHNMEAKLTSLII